MPRGQPDYGMYSVSQTIARVADMGELAVRLGSIVTFDRRGDVVWFDDFESGLNKWETETLGTGASVVASAEKARNGAFSAKLTTGDAVDDYAAITHTYPYPVPSKVGFEISFTIETDSVCVEIYQDLRTGSYRHFCGLRYDPAAQELYYWDENTIWQVLASNVRVVQSDYVFHTIKLVVDLTTQKYVRAIFNDVEYDMSELSYYYISGVELPCWIQKFYVLTSLALNQQSRVDDAIITQNEP